MIATLWIFLALAALARADETATVTSSAKSWAPSTTSQVRRAMLAGPQVPLYHFLSANYAITDAFIAG